MTQTYAEAVEAALDAAGLAWRRREDGWAVPADGRLVPEIDVQPEPEGVRVEVVLTSWDEEADTTALAQFLTLAQQCLRFARPSLTAGQAGLAAYVPAGDVETALPRTVAGVAAEARLLAREAAVLLLPQVARAYLEFFRRNVGKPEPVGA
jgi:hypothetical protein